MKASKFTVSIRQRPQSGGSDLGGARLPIPGQQLVQPVLRRLGDGGEYVREPGLRVLQHVDDQAECRRIDIGADDHSMAVRKRDLHAPARYRRCRGRSRRTRRHDRWNEPGRRCRSIFAVLLAPLEQKRGRNVVASCRRRDLAAAGETLLNNPSLLLDTPAPTPARRCVHHRKRPSPSCAERLETGMAELYRGSWRAWQDRCGGQGYASQLNPTPHQSFRLHPPTVRRRSRE